MSITYSGCESVALGIQYEMRMRHIVIRGLPHTFHVISQIARFSGGKKLLNTKCVFWFSLQLLSEIFLILRRYERDIIKKMYIGLHVKHTLFLFWF